MRMCAVSKRKFRTQLMSRAASIAILAGLTAGCSSDVSRFSEPFYSGSTSNQKAILASKDPAPVDETYTGSIGNSGQKHIPSVNDVPFRAPNHAVATHNPNPRDSSRGNNGVEPVTQSRLDPLPPMPVNPSSQGQSDKSARAKPARTDPDSAHALPKSVIEAAQLPPMPARVSSSSTDDNAGNESKATKIAALPLPRPGSRRGPAHDPIQTGSLPKATRDERSAAPRAASGWSGAGGSMVTVADGDTGHTLSRRYGVPLNAILAANNMRSANDIQPGQRVIIPTYVYSSVNPAQSADKGLPQGRDAYRLLQGAPVPVGRPGRSGQTVSRKSISTGSTSTDLAGGYYTVRPGDSVAAIAQKFDTTPAGLRAVNGLDADALLWIGQKLRIPSSSGGTRVAGLDSARPASEENRVSNAVQELQATPSPKPPGYGRRRQSASSGDAKKAPQAIAKPRSAPSRQVVASRTPASSDAASTAVVAEKPVAINAQGTFSWPAKGPIISRFGRKANGERNDGINISVPAGAPVKAAEKGVVIYSGNELKGYGNLVLVRHSEGWVSAYAHNGKLSVERGDAVRKGQVIATAGDTGSVSEPQVHFELRRNSKPVDPIPLMASN